MATIPSESVDPKRIATTWEWSWAGRDRRRLRDALRCRTRIGPLRRGCTVLHCDGGSGRIGDPGAVHRRNCAGQAREAVRARCRLKVSRRWRTRWPPPPELSSAGLTRENERAERLDHSNAARMGSHRVFGRTCGCRKCLRSGRRHADHDRRANASSARTSTTSLPSSAIYRPTTSPGTCHQLPDRTPCENDDRNAVRHRLTAPMRDAPFHTC